MSFRVGIIDDDSTKITQLLTFVKLAFNDENGNLIKDKYKDITLEPFEIPLNKNLDTMIENILLYKPDALIIDFKLSSLQNISYSGAILAQALDKKMKGFPIFILTSYQDDLYAKESIDVYQVFDFERYINEQLERFEINSKIVEQIKKYNTTLEKWKKELTELISHMGENISFDERILELDNLIENSIDGVSSLSSKLKKDLWDTSKIQQLIDKINNLIEE